MAHSGLWDVDSRKLKWSAWLLKGWKVVEDEHPCAELNMPIELGRLADWWERLEMAASVKSMMWTARKWKDSEKEVSPENSHICMSGCGRSPLPSPKMWLITAPAGCLHRVVIEVQSVRRGTCAWQFKSISELRFSFELFCAFERWTFCELELWNLCFRQSFLFRS